MGLNLVTSKHSSGKRTFVEECLLDVDLGSQGSQFNEHPTISLHLDVDSVAQGTLID